MTANMLPQDSGRPNPVQFEMRPIEDRAASQEAGHYVGRDVAYVMVHQPGQTAQIFEDIAEQWLARKERDGDPHYEHYRRCYERFKEGEEEPVAGTSVRMWPVLTPVQLKVLRSLNINTIEDVAAMTETTMMKVGPGARAVKQKAEIWLASSESSGQVTEKLADFEIQLEELRRINEELRESNKTLKAKVDEAEARAPAPAKKAAPKDKAA